MDERVFFFCDQLVPKACPRRGHARQTDRLREAPSTIMRFNVLYLVQYIVDATRGGGVHKLVISLQ